MMSDPKNMNDNTAVIPSFYTSTEKRELEQALLANLKIHHTELASLLVSMSDHAYEDTIYRFYAHSCKLYHHAPHRTGEIVAALLRLAPQGTTLCLSFEEINQTSGQEKPFSLECNTHWNQYSRPFIEAFFHARYFLEMAVKYGSTLDSPPSYLPSGWAALLCLYDIR